MVNSKMLKSDLVKCYNDIESDNLRLQTKIDLLECQTQTLRDQIEDLKDQNSILSSDFSELQKSIKLSEDVSFYADCYVQLQNECESTLSHKCNELNNLYKQRVESSEKFIFRFKVLLLLMLVITAVTSSLAVTLTYHAYDLNNKLNEAQTNYKDTKLKLESKLDTQASLYRECTSKVDTITLQLADKSNQLNVCTSNKKSSSKSDSKTIRAK